MKIDKEFADSFAKHWIDSWNSHDLEAILSHYTEDFELYSPIIPERMGIPEGKLKGKASVGKYWAIGLSTNPKLYFEFINVFIGVESLVIYYKGRKGYSSEVFYFNNQGKVCRAVAHYE
ncbi:YybH family protein [Marinobacterium rhizophilum]|uniref:YybH family protein n=1 Tax=Marinobacterium rhizophilum TaxID=420402 RepID=UPI00036D2036|nr:nuclear transport factor 2 family protein [Marinobacterium rhizophilum]